MYFKLLVLTHIGTEIFKIFHIPTRSFVEFPDKNVFHSVSLESVDFFVCIFLSILSRLFGLYWIYSSAKNILIEPVQDRCRENV